MAPDTPQGKDAGKAEGKTGEVTDLETRRKALDMALSARNDAEGRGETDRRTGGGAGFASALKLSSEFIGGILVGAGIGYLIDRLAGTSPWGMIVFLLLGFVAGILNVLRSAGVVADPEKRTRSGDKPGG
ncbi:MAG: AtpZ/AtpI family protein [Oricola sp.]|nr:AtpZ/AtpI family protein [Oricola sp.]